MLRRAGFDATGPQIDAVVNQDLSAYLDQALDLDPDTDPGAVATPRPMPVTPGTSRRRCRRCRVAGVHSDAGAEWMGKQNQKLRALKLGEFHTLAYAMLTDAAMLFWLDSVRNSAGAANENLSREFMELFTLGHGNGHSEDDVRQGARALTGWFIRPRGQGRDRHGAP
jgi:Protein of unknown function (DUF1800)